MAQAARLVVSGDTGPLHIACAVGTPVVALFGPSSAERNGPWSLDDRVSRERRRASASTSGSAGVPRPASTASPRTK